ncbi:Holliday junction branch migration protein RuvA, partial [Candidatus Wolfebacteria bacterium]|nr:Holliday junction branch migration protein RuvA [Candidatus Wolfebacteria bacterium]
PRVALNILSIAAPKELALAIMKEDAAFLTKVAGVGRKIAEKVILELKDKIGKLDFGVKSGDEQLIDTDALDALTSLGYSLKDVRDALRQVPAEISGIENRVKAALKMLGRK